MVWHVYVAFDTNIVNSVKLRPRRFGAHKALGKPLLKVHFLPVYCSVVSSHPKHLSRHDVLVRCSRDIF